MSVGRIGRVEHNHDAARFEDANHRGDERSIVTHEQGDPLSLAPDSSVQLPRKSIGYPIQLFVVRLPVAGRDSL